MKVYKWFRGLLKASALTTVMFIMQACYGTPHDFQEIRISGRIIDKTTSLPIQGIRIGGFGGYENTVSDENGYFTFYIIIGWPSDCEFLSFIDTQERYQSVNDTLICGDLENILIEMNPIAK